MFLARLRDSLLTEEFVHTGLMTCNAGMVIEGGLGPKMSLESFLKGPYTSSYVLFITLQPVTLVSIDYSTFLCDGVLWGHKKISDGDSGGVLSL